MRPKVLRNFFAQIRLRPEFAATFPAKKEFRILWAPSFSLACLLSHLSLFFLSLLSPLSPLCRLSQSIYPPLLSSLSLRHYSLPPLYTYLLTPHSHTPLLFVFSFYHSLFLLFLSLLSPVCLLSLSISAISLFPLFTLTSVPTILCLFSLFPAITLFTPLSHSPILSLSVSYLSLLSLITSHILISSPICKFCSRFCLVIAIFAFDRLKYSNKMKSDPPGFESRRSCEVKLLYS